MKTLLEFFARYLDCLYLDPRYRLTGSGTSGDPSSNAWLRLTGDNLRWELSNDRGQVVLSVSPGWSNASEHWFWLSLVRQHLDGGDERSTLLDDESVTWLGQNLSQIEELLADKASSGPTSEALVALRRKNALERWGPVAPSS